MMNIDNAQLSRVFSALGNRQTGLGTARDKSAYSQINAPAILSRGELNALYRTSSVIRRVVDYFPEDAVGAWMRIAIGEGDPADVVEQYLRGIGEQPDLEKGEPRHSVEGAFQEAARLARLHGNAAVLVGVADGLESWEPVDMGAIASVRWVMPVPRHCINRDGVYFDILVKGHQRERWHESRVLWFRGAEILDTTDSNAVGFDDSVIQAVYGAFSAYWGATAAAALMVQDFDQGVFSIEGLADMMKGTADEQRQVMDRFTSLDLGRSVARSVVLDRALEEFEYVGRNLAGVKDIAELLKNDWVSATGLPSWKLFGSTTGAGLATANTAGLAARFEWAALVRSWAVKNLLPQYRALVRMCFAARDCPQDEPATWKIIPNDAITLTPLEKMELQKMAAERDQINVAGGIYSADEARRQYQAVDFDGAIVVEEQPPVDAGAVREDWKAGLIDDVTALTLLGYPNPEAIAARLAEKRSEGFPAY